VKDRQLSFAFKLALAFLVLAGLVLVLARISWVIYLVVIALLIVYSISPAVDFLTRFKKVPHLLAVVIVYIGFLLLLALLLYLVIPLIITQLRELVRLLPQYSPYFQPYIMELGDIFARPEVVEFILNFLQQLPSNLQQVLNQATKVTMTIVGYLAELVIVLFLVFYLLRDLEKIKKTLAEYIPRPWRQETLRILGTIDAKVGAYLRGHLIRCTLVGIVCWLGLSIIGMPFALMLGALVGVSNLLPYIGPYLAAVPAVIIALTRSWTLAVVVVIFYIIIEIIDSFVLTPLLLGRAVDLHPFAVIVAILVGGRLFGFLGIILAIPIAATLKVLLNYYCLQKKGSNQVK
jgi:predicted PurR-regulated permease PerM